RLCHLVMTEHVHTVICGGIEEEVFDYLTWKRVEVLDDIIGLGAVVLRRYAAGRLRPGEIVHSETRALSAR
ncbi:MAG: hypothetical protein WAU91_08160, partial [Desulfatitalea sp.]